MHVRPVSAGDASARGGVASHDANQTLLSLSSKAELLCDLEGREAFRGTDWPERVAAFAAVGASEIAAGVRTRSESRGRARTLTRGLARG